MKHVLLASLLHLISTCVVDGARISLETHLLGLIETNLFLPFSASFDILFFCFHFCVLRNVLCSFKAISNSDREARSEVMVTRLRKIHIGCGWNLHTWMDERIPWIRLSSLCNVLFPPSTVWGLFHENTLKSQTNIEGGEFVFKFSNLCKF